MTTQKDELARDIFLADNTSAAPGLMEKEWDENPTTYHYAHAIAEGLIAKGYRKPRTITTHEELGKLRRGATIVEPNGCIWVNDGQNEDPWASFGEDPFGGPIWTDSSFITLPAILVHDPEVAA